MIREAQARDESERSAAPHPAQRSLARLRARARARRRAVEREDFGLRVFAQHDRAGREQSDAKVAASGRAPHARHAACRTPIDAAQGSPSRAQPHARVVPAATTARAARGRTAGNRTDVQRRRSRRACRIRHCRRRRHAPVQASRRGPAIAKVTSPPRCTSASRMQSRHDTRGHAIVATWDPFWSSTTSSRCANFSRSACVVRATR